MGIVLLVVAWRLIRDIATKPGNPRLQKQSNEKTCKNGNGNQSVKFYRGQQVCFSIPAVILPAFGVGVGGGTYGIGGGATMAPFLVSVLHLPVHAVAGAVLLANFTISLAGMDFTA